MRFCIAAVLACLAATPLSAQTSQKSGQARTALDSGTVVRLHWKDGTEKARLLAPLGPDSSSVRYCRYPARVCGTSSVNPSRTRPISDLTRLDIRRGSRTARGALIGGGAGAVGGLLIILGHSLSDRPALSGGEQLVTVVSLAAAWSGIGALVGASSDNWEAVRR